MGMDSSQLVRIAWAQLSESIPLTLHEFRGTRAIHLRENLWRLEKQGASLNIQLLAEEQEIRVTRRMPNGSVTERQFRISSAREDRPLLADPSGNLASPIIVLNDLLAWLVQGSQR
jgi:hypothetical protein